MNHLRILKAAYWLLGLWPFVLIGWALAVLMKPLDPQTLLELAAMPPDEIATMVRFLAGALSVTVVFATVLMLAAGRSLGNALAEGIAMSTLFAAIATLTVAGSLRVAAVLIVAAAIRAGLGLVPGVRRTVTYSDPTPMGSATLRPSTSPFDRLNQQGETS